jgi:hypothetical protein
MHLFFNTYFALLCFLFITYQFLFGGECLDSYENYLNELDSLQSDDMSVEYPLGCFTLGVYVGSDYKMICGKKPHPSFNIDRSNEPESKKLIQILPKYLSAKNPNIRYSAATALALWGWKDQSCISYLMMDTLHNLHPEPIFLAALGDKHAIPYLINRFKYFDNLYRKKPLGCYCFKMNILNALYYLADPALIPFLEEIIKTPRNIEYKNRAELVLNRVRSLYSKDSIQNK